MATNTDSEEIAIDKEVAEAIRNRVSKTKFVSVEEYINHVLGEIVHQTKETTELSDESEVDEKEVKERLRSLGYINE